jgi:SAM-dependent methyltransferase
MTVRMRSVRNRPKRSVDEPRFEEITETTGSSVVPEGAQMLFTRYSVAAKLALGKRVLELGCGSGLGFGLLSAEARWLVGGDYSAALLAKSRDHYKESVPLVRLDAQALPFTSNSFDLVLLFEAAYYIPSLSHALAEIVKVLSPGGMCLIVSANPERLDFIPSPHSVKYHSADEFRSILAEVGMKMVEIHGAFPTTSPALTWAARLRGAVLSLARSALRELGLVPRTLKGRALLKRLIYSKQVLLPAEIPPAYSQAAPLEPLQMGPAPSFKVIYIKAQK